MHFYLLAFLATLVSPQCVTFNATSMEYPYLPAGTGGALVNLSIPLKGGSPTQRLAFPSNATQVTLRVLASTAPAGVLTSLGAVYMPLWASTGNLTLNASQWLPTLQAPLVSLTLTLDVWVWNATAGAQGVPSPLVKYVNASCGAPPTLTLLLYSPPPTPGVSWLAPPTSLSLAPLSPPASNPTLPIVLPLMLPGWDDIVGTWRAAMVLGGATLGASKAGLISLRYTASLDPTLPPGSPSAASIVVSGGGTTAAVASLNFTASYMGWVGMNLSLSASTWAKIDALEGGGTAVRSNFTLNFFIAGCSDAWGQACASTAASTSPLPLFILRPPAPTRAVVWGGVTGTTPVVHPLPILPGLATSPMNSTQNTSFVITASAVDGVVGGGWRAQSQSPSPSLLFAVLCSPGDGMSGEFTSMAPLFTPFPQSQPLFMGLSLSSLVAYFPAGVCPTPSGTTAAAAAAAAAGNYSTTTIPSSNNFTVLAVSQLDPSPRSSTSLAFTLASSDPIGALTAAYALKYNNTPPPFAPLTSLPFNFTLLGLDAPDYGTYPAMLTSLSPSMAATLPWVGGLTSSPLRALSSLPNSNSPLFSASYSGLLTPATPYPTLSWAVTSVTIPVAAVGEVAPITVRIGVRLSVPFTPSSSPVYLRAAVIPGCGWDGVGVGVGMGMGGVSYTSCSKPGALGSAQFDAFGGPWVGTGVVAPNATTAYVTVTLSTGDPWGLYSAINGGALPGSLTLPLSLTAFAVNLAAPATLVWASGGGNALIGANSTLTALPASTLLPSNASTTLVITLGTGNATAVASAAAAFPPSIQRVFNQPSKGGILTLGSTLRVVTSRTLTSSLTSAASRASSSPASGFGVFPVALATLPSAVLASVTNPLAAYSDPRQFPMGVGSWEGIGSALYALEWEGGISPPSSSPVPPPTRVFPPNTPAFPVPVDIGASPIPTVNPLSALALGLDLLTVSTGVPPALPSATATASHSWAPTPSSASTTSPTASLTPTITALGTLTRTVTPASSPSATVSPSASTSVSGSSSFTPSLSSYQSPSFPLTPSPFWGASLTPGGTLTPGAFTASIGPSSCASSTPAPSFSPAPSSTLSASVSSTATPQITLATFTATLSNTLTSIITVSTPPSPSPPVTLTQVGSVSPTISASSYSTNSNSGSSATSPSFIGSPTTSLSLAASQTMATFTPFGGTGTQSMPSTLTISPSTSPTLSLSISTSSTTSVTSTTSITYSVSTSPSATFSVSASPSPTYSVSLSPSATNHTGIKRMLGAAAPPLADVRGGGGGGARALDATSANFVAPPSSALNFSDLLGVRVSSGDSLCLTLDLWLVSVPLNTSAAVASSTYSPITSLLPPTPIQRGVPYSPTTFMVYSGSGDGRVVQTTPSPFFPPGSYHPYAPLQLKGVGVSLLLVVWRLVGQQVSGDPLQLQLHTLVLTSLNMTLSVPPYTLKPGYIYTAIAQPCVVAWLVKAGDNPSVLPPTATQAATSILSALGSDFSAPVPPPVVILPSSTSPGSTWATDAWAGFIGGGALRPTIIHCHAPLSNISLQSSPPSGFDISTNFTLTAQVLPDTTASVSDAGVRATSNPSILLSIAAMVSLQQPLPPSYYTPLSLAYGGVSALVGSGGGFTTPTVSSANATLYSLLSAATALSVSPTPSSLLNCPSAADLFPALPFWSVAAQAASQALSVSPTTACASLYIAASTVAANAVNGGRPLTLPLPTPPSFTFYQVGNASAVDLLKGSTLSNPALFAPPPSGQVWTKFGTPLSSLHPSLSPTLTSVFLPYTGNTVSTTTPPSSWPSTTALNTSVALFVLVTDEEGGVGVGGGTASIAPSFPFTSTTYAALSNTPQLGVVAVASALTTLTTSPPCTISPANALALLSTLSPLLPTVTTPTLTSVSKALALLPQVAPLRASIATSVLSSLVLIGASSITGGSAPLQGFSVSSTTGAVTLVAPLPLSPFVAAATAQQAATVAQWKVDTTVLLNPSLALLAGITLAGDTGDTSFTIPSPATTLVIPALVAARATALLSLPACVLTGAASALTGGYATLPSTTTTFSPSIASALLTTVANSIPTLNYSSAISASSSSSPIIASCASAGSNCTFTNPATLRPYLLRALSSVVAAFSSASIPSTSPPLYVSARVTPTPTPSLTSRRELQASALTTSTIRAYLNNPATFSLSTVTQRVFTGGSSAVTLTLPVSFPPVAAIPASYSPISLAVAASLTVSNYSLLKGSAAAVGVFVGAGVPPPTLTLPAATLLAVGSGSTGITFDVSLTQWGVSGLAETSGWSSQAYYFTGVISNNSTLPGLGGKSNGTATSPSIPAATVPPYILTPPSTLAQALQLAPRQVDTLTIPPSQWAAMNTPSTAAFPPTSPPSIAGVYPDVWSAFSATGLSQYARVYGTPLLDLVPGRPLDTRAVTVSVGAMDGVTAPPLQSIGVYQNTSLVLDTPTLLPALPFLNDGALPSPSISLVLPLIDPLAPGGGGLAPYLTSNPPIAYSVQCPGWVLAGAAQPSDFTSAAPTFPVAGVDSVGGSIRFVYPPTLNGSFVPTPATPTSTATTTSLPLSKITYISVTAYTGGVREGTLSALPSQGTGGGWGVSANTMQPLPPNFLAGVKTGRSFPIRAPIFSLAVDCGPNVGARTVHCGPGFYGASVWYTCPVLTPLATCAVWNESSASSSGGGVGRFTTSQCTATLPLASSATSPPMAHTPDALSSASAAAAAAGEGVGGLTLTTAISPATKGIACACSGIAGGTFGGRFAGVAVETPDSFLVATVVLGDPRGVTPGSSLWVMFFIPAVFWLYTLRILGKKDRKAALPFVRALLEDEEMETLSGFDTALGIGGGGGGGFSLDTLLDSTVLGALEVEALPGASTLSSSSATTSSPSSSAPSSRQIHSPAFAALLHASSPHPLSTLVTKGYHFLYSGKQQRKGGASHPVSSLPPPLSPTEKTFNPLTSVIEGASTTITATATATATASNNTSTLPRPVYASLLSALSPLKVTLQGISEEGVLQAGGVRKDVYTAVKGGDYRWMALMRLVRDSSKVQWGEIDGEDVGEEEEKEKKEKEKEEEEAEAGQQQPQRGQINKGRGGGALSFLPRVSLCFYICCLRLRLTQPIPGTLYTFDPTFPRLHRALAVGVTSLVGLFLSAYLLAFRNGIPGQDLLPNGATDWESLAVGSISAGLQFIVYLIVAALIKRTLSTPYWHTRYPSLAKELQRRGVGDHSLRHLSPRLLSVELGGPCASALHGAHPGHPGLLPPGILYDRAIEDARMQRLNSQLASQRGGGGMGGGATLPNFTPHSPASPGSVPQYPTLAQQPLPPMAIPRWGGNTASSMASSRGQGGNNTSLAVGREPWHYGYTPPPSWAVKSIPFLKGVWKGWETAVEKEVEKETLKLNAARAVRAAIERTATFSSSSSASASPVSYLGSDRLAERLERVGDGVGGVGVKRKKGKKGPSVLTSTSPTNTALAVVEEGASPRLSRKHTTAAPKRAPLIPFLSLNPHSLPTLLTLLCLAALSVWCVAYIFTFSATQSSGASSSASIAFVFSFFALHCIIQPVALGLLLILQVILAPTLAALTRWWCPVGVRRWGEGVWGESMDPQGGTSWPLWARLALLVLPRAAGAAEGLPAFASVLANDNIHLVLAALSHTPTPNKARVPEDKGEVGEALRRELIKRRYILARLKGVEATWQGGGGGGGGGGKGKSGGGGGRSLSPFPTQLPVQYPPTLAPWAVLSASASAYAYAPPPPPSPPPVPRRRSDSTTLDTPKVNAPPPVWLSSSSSVLAPDAFPPRPAPALPQFSNPLLRASSASSRVLGGGGAGGYTPRVVEDPSLATPNILIKALLAKNVVRRAVDNQ